LNRDSERIPRSLLQGASILKLKRNFLLAFNLSLDRIGRTVGYHPGAQQAAFLPYTAVARLLDGFFP